MTQAEAVAEYLKHHGSITQDEATHHLGITRLAARISDLQGRGIDIPRKMIRVPTRYGRDTYIAKYLRPDEWR